MLVVVNQDYVTPADFVGAVRDAGLERFAYRGPVDGRWPTLREMIDSEPARAVPGREPGRRRALVPPGLRDDPAGDAVRVLPAGQLTDPAGLAATCRPNRGPAGAPLFLVNHWITTDPVPLPSNAAA